jgi:hypothetical protein
MYIELDFDTTQVVAADRVKLRINGVSQTFGQNYGDMPQGYTGVINYNYQHRIGSNQDGGAYLGAHLSEVNFTDGYIPPQTANGQIDSVTGQWTAKKFVGTYGTNGFYLPFSDTTSPTTLCYDASGNGNHWTPNNISTTTGATYDSMTDVPLAYGTVDRGNYCTLNPLDKSASVVLSKGNLNGSHSGASWITMRSSIPFPETGKWYVEAQLITSVGNGMVGLGTASAGLGNYAGADAFGWSYSAGTGQKFTSGAGAAYGATYATTDIIGVAFDASAGTLTFYKNNVSQGVAYSGLSSGPYFLMPSANQNEWEVNFGQRPFAYTPPTGFKSLHTGNLTSDTVTVSGSFTGNLSVDGPCIWLNGTPETLTINGNAVTWGTHADKLASGFKLRSSSASYNASGTNTWTATILSPSLKSSFRNQLAKAN